MSALSRLCVVFTLAACIAGCAAPRPSSAPAVMVAPERTRTIAADRIRNAVAVGRSTKGDVIAALGETLVIRFESGFEVWIYRLASDKPDKTAQAWGSDRGGSEKPEARTASEFVVLFAPSGLVAKMRVRPAPLRKDEGGTKG